MTERFKLANHLFAFLLCTFIWFPCPARESSVASRVSPKLKQFLADHREAARILTNSISEVFSNRAVAIFYFYSEDESTARAFHFYPGTVGTVDVVICVRENQQPLDEFICLLFETLNSRGEPQFTKLCEQAQAGTVSREDFVRGILKTEFEATKSSRALLASIKVGRKESAASQYYKHFTGCPTEFEAFLSYTKRLSRSRDVFKEYAAQYDALRKIRQ
jgi:hypothetical protein